MTFNQLKEYHLKQLSITLTSGITHEGIIISHRWSKDDIIASVSVLTSRSVERISCSEIREVVIIGPVLI